jgi:hypothetical protein
MKRALQLFILLSLVASVAGARSALRPATDISGTWVFSVDLENGSHGDPTFVFKQDKESLTGTYEGPLGQYNVSGTVKDDKTVFSFEYSNDSGKHKVTYNGTVESATKMSGTIDLSVGQKGKWTATKK